LTATSSGEPGQWSEIADKFEKLPEALIVLENSEQVHL